MMEPQNGLQAVLTWLSMLWNCLLSAFAFVTLLFAFFSWRGIPVNRDFDFDSLPTVPKKREQISRWECITGIAFCIFFMVVFLGVPQVFAAWLPETNERIPVFDAAAIRQGWHWIALLAVFGIAGETEKLLEGRYNRNVLLVTLGTNFLSAVAAILWLTQYNLMSPEFTAHLSQLFGEGEEIVVTLFSNFQMFFLGVLLFALVLDTVEAVIRTLRK